MKYVTKLNTFVAFLVLGALAGFFLAVDPCIDRSGILDVSCGKVWNALTVTSAFSLSLFLPFLISLPLKKSIFKCWKAFAVWAVPLSMFLTHQILTMKTGGFIDIRPALYLIVLYGSYFLISLIIILRAWWKSRKSSS